MQRRLLVDLTAVSDTALVGYLDDNRAVLDMHTIHVHTLTLVCPVENLNRGSAGEGIRIYLAVRGGASYCLR
jgi:allophanate hydrolase subunit 2